MCGLAIHTDLVGRQPELRGPDGHDDDVEEEGDQEAAPEVEVSDVRKPFGEDVFEGPPFGSRQRDDVVGDADACGDFDLVLAWLPLVGPIGPNDVGRASPDYGVACGGRYDESGCTRSGDGIAGCCASDAP